MSDRPTPPQRAEYAVWRTATTRWADDDAYGHLNNARYYELFDTAVNAFLFEGTGTNIRHLSAIGLVAETSCRYYREIGFPEPIDVGLNVERLGGSSVIYRIGLFQGPGDLAAAEGRFVHVYVENTTRGRRRVCPVPAPIRDLLQPLVSSGGRHADGR